ncbi:SIS domain-containing protein, partial [Klebsiella variicola]|uniref:SIS domain-containing protein n=1 Tax=Klebsiella variicola TaxID=244366 RepID=UPI000B104680
ALLRNRYSGRQNNVQPRWRRRWPAARMMAQYGSLVIYSDDIVLQRMSCMNCDDDDVVVIISHTGRTKSLVELAQLARENDAMVIALTSAGTPLAREATLAITLDVPEDTDIYMPMVSRLAQLTVIDVLATGFTLRRGAKFRDNLKRVKEALKESRFDKEPFVPSDNQ